MGSNGQSRHRRTARGFVADGYDVTRVLWWVRAVVAAMNAAVSGAFIAAPAGEAPSIVLLREVAPLLVWGIAFAAVAALLLAGRHIPAHLVAVPLWTFWAVSALVGVAAGRSSSPAVTLALTALILGVAALHVNGLPWRRAEARTRAT